MPRTRLSQNFSPAVVQQQQQQQHHPHLVSNSSPMMTQHQQQEQQQQQQQQYRHDLNVQRSQGVIFLTTNKPQVTAPPLSMPSLTPGSGQQQLLQHQIPAPAHSASMYQPQHVPGFIPPGIMQHPFFPYYAPVPPQQIQQQMPQAPMVSQSNDLYTPNGATTINYDDFMQAPPPPIKGRAKRKSRKRFEDSSDSSVDSEFMDDEEDPDWNPGANPPPQEPQEPPSPPAARGRRASATSRGGGRGRARGRGRGGRGRGRGRGGYNDSSQQETPPPPTLMDQTAQFFINQNVGGRQTRRSSQGLSYNMPALDPQHGVSIGQLVSQAVQSLNDDGDPDYSPVSGSGSGRGAKKRPKRLMAAVLRKENNYICVERVPAQGEISLFIYVDTSIQPATKEDEDEAGLEEEDEDLIMSYEIMQDEDKQRSFLCESCGHPSKSRVLHNRHLVSHDPSFTFACCICSQLFASHDKLKPHLRTHHGSGIFVCPDTECEGVFSERRSLDDHEFACHPDARPFVCRFCFDRFPTIEDSRAHEDGHPEDIEAGCMKCSETYEKKSLLKQHYSDMHEEKQCQFCEEKFPNKPGLDEHQNEKHAELLKPPTPPPPPSPIMDDDPISSPIGGDDDDIVMVEQHKGTAKSPAKPIIKRTPSKPETRKSVKFSESGPSKKTFASRPIKSKPDSNKSPIKTKVSDEIIVLSSDEDDKDPDPEWKVPGRDRRNPRRRSVPTPPSPVKRSTRNQKQSEYVIVVEASTEESSSAAKSSELTFVVGESGDIRHVPTASNPNPPDSLPMKEIMDIIRSKNLAENTTIVIEDDKIASIKSTKSPSSSSKSGGSSSSRTPSSSASMSRPSTSRNGNRDSQSKRWIRPPPAEVIEIAGPKKPAILQHSRPKDTFKQADISAKPPSLVAKKRTGGLSRTDKEKIVEKVRSTESPKPSSLPLRPIAKKRTGGSSSMYNDMKRNKSENKGENNEPLAKQPRKEFRPELSDPDPLGFDDDDDEPLIIETILPPPKPKPFTSGKVPIPALVPLSRSHNSTSNKNKGKTKPPERREIPIKPKPVSEITPVVYDEAPKRSLRIALKASVSESTTNYDESQEDPIPDDSEFIVPTTINRNSGSGKRKSSLAVQPTTYTNITPTPPATSVPLNSKRSTTSASPVNATSADGQIIMKAFVNGKWQDVVIGTKLSGDDSEPIASTSQDTYIPEMSNSVISKSSGGGRKKGPTPAKPAPAARGGKRKGGGRGKGKKAVPDSADCWSDDRYQYFSEGQRSLNMNQSSVYANAENMYDGYGNDSNISNSYVQEGYEQEQGDDADEVLPFSLSTYMSYHHDETPQTEDQDIPVIVSAYHVQNDNSTSAYPGSFQNHDDASQELQMQVDDDDQVDEIPIHDPLAMDDVPTGEPEPEAAVEEEEEEEDDPLAGSTQAIVPPPVVEPKKGTIQDAKSAISNLRSVLSQITFKK